MIEFRWATPWENVFRAIWRAKALISLHLHCLSKALMNLELSVGLKAKALMKRGRCEGRSIFTRYTSEIPFAHGMAETKEKPFLYILKELYSLQLSKFFWTFPFIVWTTENDQFLATADTVLKNNPNRFSVKFLYFWKIVLKRIMGKTLWNGCNTSLSLFSTTVPDIE